MDYILIFVKGFKLDLSLAAYLLLFPTLCILLLSVLKSNLDIQIIRVYTIILVPIISLLYIIDLELYNYWQYRLDDSFLNYINTPADMLASLAWYHYIIIISLLALFYFLIYRLLFSSLFSKTKQSETRPNWKTSLIFLFVLPGLLLPIRGGLGTAPLNVGTAYFHKNTIVNHAAINPVWNLIYTLTEADELDNQYSFFSKEEEDELLKPFKTNSDKSKQVLKTNRPNIIIIILESFTSSIIEESGGEPGVTPNISRFLKDGIFFENIYASGVSSPIGIGAVLAGYPSLPDSYILKYESKVESIPGIGKELAKHGYKNKFYYGGDIDFGHIRSFLVNNQFDEITSIKDFPASDNISNWGVPDHIVLNRLLEETNRAEESFFNVLFTLSSHEPYDVPMETVFNGNSRKDKFYNAAYYTDKSLGQFIESAKKQLWWENTVVILVADHGARLDNIVASDNKRFHIPLVFLGGALNVRDTIISKYGNQTDIAATLAGQMDLDRGLYKYSRDLLSTDSLSYSYYLYNKGIGYLDDNKHIVYDINGDRFIVEEGSYNITDKDRVKAILQNLQRDFTSR